jgi:hypothetical protein
MLLVVSHASMPGMVHWSLLVQPARHVPPRLHTGVVPLQSAFDAHSAHA